LIASCSSAARHGADDPAPSAALSIYQIKDPRVPAPAPTPEQTAQATRDAAQGKVAPVEPVAAALVTERRWISLAEGKNEVGLGGVAALLEPSSTWLASLTDPDHTRVVELAFDPGWNLERAALAGWIGQEVEISVAKERLRGNLLALADGEIALALPGGTT